VQRLCALFMLDAVCTCSGYVRSVTRYSTIRYKERNFFYSQISLRYSLCVKYGDVIRRLWRQQIVKVRVDLCRMLRTALRQLAVAVAVLGLQTELRYLYVKSCLFSFLVLGC
jgi:hypothetical protein